MVPSLFLYFQHKVTSISVLFRLHALFSFILTFYISNLFPTTLFHLLLIHFHYPPMISSAPWLLECILYWFLLIFLWFTEGDNPPQVRPFLGEDKVAKLLLLLDSTLAPYLYISLRTQEREIIIFFKKLCELFNLKMPWLRNAIR